MAKLKKRGASAEGGAPRDVLAALLRAAGRSKGYPPVSPDEVAEVCALADDGYVIEFAGPEAAGVGTSRAWGAPDLPAGAAWPTHPADPAVPLAFVAQIDLTEVPPGPARGDLPSEGLLSLFYDRYGFLVDLGMPEPAACRVLYTPAGTPVAPRAEPAHRAQDHFAAEPARRLTFRPLVMLPPSYDPRVSQLSDGEGIDTLEINRRWLESQRAYGAPRLLGYAHALYEPGELYEQRPKTKRWRLLAQFTAPEGQNLFFWVRASDLSEGAFERACLTVER